MTEEQIKQNAEYFATHLNGKIAPFSSREYEAFIAGAHSLDEEIEELKKKLEDMTKLKNFFASSLDIYDKDNRELQDELTELRTTCRYDIVKNGKTVATFFDMFQAHDYCERNGGNIEVTRL